MWYLARFYTFPFFELNDQISDRDFGSRTLNYAQAYTTGYDMMDETLKK